MPYTVVIVNPRARGGRMGRRWSTLQEQMRAKLGSFDARITEAPGHAIELSASALEAGAEVVVAVGGDGTANEVLAGFVDDQGRNRFPHAELGLFAGGTGSDFMRHLGRFDVAQQVDALGLDGQSIDYGVAQVRSGDARYLRPFLNEASVGVSGLIVQRAANMRPWLSPGLHYGVASVGGIATHRPCDIAIYLDERPVARRKLTAFVMANGRYFGGGMPIAPEARCDDGWLDLISLGDLPWWRVMRLFAGVYTASHVGRPEVGTDRARQIVLEADPDDRVLVEADGESLGTLPGRFSIVPAGIRVRAAGLGQQRAAQPSGHFATRSA